MKTAIFALIAVVWCPALLDKPTQKPVQIKLGPKAYRDGDVIEITEITSTSPKLEQGDTVTVTGRVRLDSESKADLCLFLTQTEGNGHEETDKTQTASIKEGTTKFELSATIKHRGILHITLYDTTTGRPFGGVYFGTETQVASTTDDWVKHYLR